MSRLIATTLNWMARTLGLLLLIIGILLIGTWLRSEWGQLQVMREEIGAQENVLEGLRADHEAIQTALAEDAAAWSSQMDVATRPLREELAALGERIARAEPLWQQALARFTDLERQAATARSAADAARAEVRRLERQLRFWDKFLNPERLLPVEAARARQLALEGNARSWEAARDRVAPSIAASPLAPLQRRRAQLLQDVASLTESVSPRHAQHLTARASKEQQMAELEASLATQRERMAQDPRSRLASAVRTQLPLALSILGAVLLLPLILKTFFYFVVAPLAGRLPSIRILPNALAPPIPEPRPSAVSVALDIAPGEELLVQADFLQSSSRPARKRTQWLLNSRVPFASLASGMYALTRIRPEGATSTQVVVSSQQDAFGEVGLIEIPAGAAMVVQPRSLAGVVKPAGAPVLITRHWHLDSLHAWLTLQLRYLVFHGPCRLVLKGCRGVCAEEPRPGQPRLINQSATLGFSANLEYKTTRCETFVAYLRGKEGLFNDLFAGGPGRFIYEEMPADSRRGGITGRGFQGLTDAVMKAFGI
jgi:uncharacterized protein (AIM24 family)